MKSPDSLPVLPFASKKLLASWFAKHHGKSPGLWVQIAKKGSGQDSVSYAEALDLALCWGWIDSQKRGLDATHWLQRFTPRGPKSIWSKINTGHVGRLIKAGLMKPAGLKAVEAAKADGRWKAAYHGQGRSVVPPDLKAALLRNKKAGAFFATLKSAERYAILFRLQNTKKAELRAKKIAHFVAMLAAHQGPHSLI